MIEREKYSHSYASCSEEPNEKMKDWVLSQIPFDEEGVSSKIIPDNSIPHIYASVDCNCGIDCEDPGGVGIYRFQFRFDDEGYDAVFIDENIGYIDTSFLKMVYENDIEAAKNDLENYCEDFDAISLLRCSNCGVWVLTD